MFKSISKESWFFGVMLLAITAYFMVWGLDYTQHHHVAIFTLATLFGIFMAFNIGGNDVANSFGTSVGAGTLTIKQALIVAAIFEVSGAMIAGGEVTKTIRKGIVDLSSIQVDPIQFIFIMMSALLAAALWLLFATRKGLPVSTTHSIIGGIVGSSIALGVAMNASAFSLVHWDKIGTIAISWVLSPVLGGLMSYGIFWVIKKFVLSYNDAADEELKGLHEEKKTLKQEHKVYMAGLSEHERIAQNSKMGRDAQAMQDEDFSHEDLESDYYRKIHTINEKKVAIKPYHAMQTYVPLIAALGSMIISGMVIFKGLKHIDLNFSTLDNYLVMLMIAALVWMTIFIMAKNLQGKTLARSSFFLFSWLQVFTAAGFAFSHGSNDIANAIGPFAAILDVLRTGEVGSRAAIPPIAMLTFGLAMVAGLWFIGKEVIKTVGHNLTQMHPASGFSAELGASAVILMASTFGIPVSSTHILIGAVLGIGLVNHNANWKLMKPIGLAWVITLPAAGILAALVFMGLRQIF